MVNERLLGFKFSGYSTAFTLLPSSASFTPLEERPALLFAKLARTITRHKRAVFVLWLLALVLSVPAILQVQSVIVYSETAFNPKDSESSLAQDVVSREFSINQGSSVVVVVSANDVRGNEVRDFSLALNRTLHNDPKLSNMSNSTSIYDIYSQLLVGYTSVIHLQLYQVKNLTSLATSLEFGIPNTYVNQWTSIVSSGPFNVNQAQLIAYNAKANSTSAPIIASQTPPQYQSAALAYENLFYQSWNQTFSAAGYNSFQLLVQYPPFLRAQNITKGSPLISTQPSYYNITLPFFQSLPFDSQKMSVFMRADRFFNLYSGSSGGGCSNSNCWND